MTRADKKEMARQLARALAEGKLDLYNDLLAQLCAALKG